MLAWYRVVVLVLSVIVLGTYPSNFCSYTNDSIDCNGDIYFMPTLSETLTDYRVVCIYLGNLNNLN